MRGFVLALSWLSLFSPLMGCIQTEGCPDGTMLVGERCVPTSDDGGTDAGPRADAPTDVPSNDAASCGGCAAPTPYCVADACVACRDGADCGGATPYCAAGACVACRTDPDCTSGAPFCEADVCVACRSAADCTDALAPQCSDGACVSCSGRTDCTGEQLADEIAQRVCRAAGAPPARYLGIDEPRTRVEEDSATALVCGHLEGGTALGLLVDAIRDGRIVPDLAAFETCAGLLEYLGASFTPLALSQCPTYAGQVVTGGACVLHQECASAYCRTTTSCLGTCAVRAAVGMPCTEDAACVAEAYCDAGMVCRAEVPSMVRGRGEPCAGDYECDGSIPLVCRGAPATCQDPPSAGEPCDDRDFAVCALGNYCDGTTCRARIAVGAPCTDVASCVAGARCGGSPATCRAVALPDESCDASRPCASGTECVSGRCRPLPDLGEACTSACYRGLCVGGMCASAGLGAACAAGIRVLDALDPCGANLTCIDRSGMWRCEVTVPSGSSCAAPGSVCEEPGTYCDASDRCSATCSL